MEWKMKFKIYKELKMSELKKNYKHNNDVCNCKGKISKSDYEEN